MNLDYRAVQHEYEETFNAVVDRFNKEYPQELMGFMAMHEFSEKDFRNWLWAILTKLEAQEKLYVSPSNSGIVRAIVYERAVKYMLPKVQDYRAKQAALKQAEELKQKRQAEREALRSELMRALININHFLEGKA
jgi:hypothetical protein